MNPTYSGGVLTGVTVVVLYGEYVVVVVRFDKNESIPKNKQHTINFIF